MFPQKLIMIAFLFAFGLLIFVALEFAGIGTDVSTAIALTFGVLWVLGHILYWWWEGKEKEQWDLECQERRRIKRKVKEWNSK